MSENPVTIDSYQLVNCLATGRHTQVWEASDLSSSRSVALKILLPEAFAVRTQKQSMKYEAKVGSQLDHPNIVKVLDCVVNRSHAYIAMELFRANNLKVQLRNDIHSIWLRARKLIESIAEALGHMHTRNWIHRDVKPENILLNKASEARLIDFSLAARPASSFGKMVNRKKKGPVQGTRTYMAPEQIRNMQLTAQTDIYNFGVTIFELITGRPLFRSSNPDDLLMDHLKSTPDPPSVFNENVTPEMDQMVMKMVAKNPKNRQQNIDELLSEFRNVRIFKEEIQEKQVMTEDEKHEQLLREQSDGIASRIDSRLDAMRTEALKKNPNAVLPERQPPTKQPVAKKEPPAPPPAPPQSQPGTPPPAMTPEQQAAMQQALHQQAMQQHAMQQAMQQQAMQQAWQQQAMQQAWQQQQALQQAAAQQQPGMPVPPQQMPGQPQVPPQAVPGQMPAPPQDQATPVPEANSTEKQPEKPADKKNEGTVINISDLDMFDSLPDVS